MKETVLLWLRETKRGQKTLERQMFAYVRSGLPEELSTLLHYSSAHFNINALDHQKLPAMAYAMGVPIPMGHGKSLEGKISIPCAQILLAHGAALNKILKCPSLAKGSKSQETSLLIELVRQGEKEETIQLLKVFLSQANIGIEFAPSGRTALDIAMENDFVESAKLLVKHGACWKDKEYQHRIPPYSKCYRWLSALRAAQYTPDEDGFVEIPLDSPPVSLKWHKGHFFP